RETRARAPAAGEPSPMPLPRRRRPLRTALLLLTAASVAWFMYVLAFGMPHLPTSVRSRLLDPRHRPVAGARVFLPLAPDIATTTDGEGAFTLPDVPPGWQTLVIALDGAGEEYQVRVTGLGVTEKDYFIFHVPPLPVRRSPGDGVGWSGEDPAEWTAQQHD